MEQCLGQLENTCLGDRKGEDGWIKRKSYSWREFSFAFSGYE